MSWTNKKKWGQTRLTDVLSLLLNFNHFRKFSNSSFCSFSHKQVSQVLARRQPTKNWLSCYVQHPGEARCQWWISKAWWLKKGGIWCWNFCRRLEVKDFSGWMRGVKETGLLFFLIQWTWRGEASVGGKSVLQTLLATRAFTLKACDPSIYTACKPHVSQFSPKKFTKFPSTPAVFWLKLLNGMELMIPSKFQPEHHAFSSSPCGFHRCGMSHLSIPVWCWWHYPSSWSHASRPRRDHRYSWRRVRRGSWTSARGRSWTSGHGHNVVKGNSFLKKNI